MADYASQVSKHRDRITKMLDRGPTLGEVGRAGLASVGRGRDFSTQLQAQRQATFGPEMMKLEMLREAQADEAAAAKGAFEREKFGEEKRQFEGRQKMQLRRVAAEEARVMLAGGELAFKQTKLLADQGNKDAQEVLKVFSELTEGASTESAAALWKKLYEGETQITAKNARQEIGKLASETLKTKPPTRMFQSGEEQFKYTKKVEDYKRQVKQDDKTRESASTAFNAAQDTLFHTGRMLDLMEENPNLTGAGEELFTVGKNIVNAFMRFTGKTESFDISTQQEFKSYAIRGALDLKEKLPGQISNFEVQTMLDAAAKLDKSREANLNLLYAMQAVAERVVDYNNKLIDWERDPENEGRPLRHFNQDYQRWAADNPIVAQRAGPRAAAPGLQAVEQQGGEALYKSIQALPKDQRKDAVKGMGEEEYQAFRAYILSQTQE